MTPKTRLKVLVEITFWICLCRCWVLSQQTFAVDPSERKGVLVLGQLGTILPGWRDKALWTGSAPRSDGLPHAFHSPFSDGRNIPSSFSTLDLLDKEDLVSGRKEALKPRKIRFSSVRLKPASSSKGISLTRPEKESFDRSRDLLTSLFDSETARKYLVDAPSAFEKPISKSSLPDVNSPIRLDLAIEEQERIAFTKRQGQLPPSRAFNDRRNWQLSGADRVASRLSKPTGSKRLLDKEAPPSRFQSQNDVISTTPDGTYPSSSNVKGRRKMTQSFPQTAISVSPRGPRFDDPVPLGESRPTVRSSITQAEQPDSSTVVKKSSSDLVLRSQGGKLPNIDGITIVLAPSASHPRIAGSQGQPFDDDHSTAIAESGNPSDGNGSQRPRTAENEELGREGGVVTATTIPSAARTIDGVVPNYSTHSSNEDALPHRVASASGGFVNGNDTSSYISSPLRSLESLSTVQPKSDQVFSNLSLIHKGGFNQVKGAQVVADVDQTVDVLATSSISGFLQQGPELSTTTFVDDAFSPSPSSSYTIPIIPIHGNLGAGYKERNAAEVSPKQILNAESEKTGMNLDTSFPAPFAVDASNVHTDDKPFPSTSRKRNDFNHDFSATVGDFNNESDSRLGTGVTITAPAPAQAVVDGRHQAANPEESRDRSQHTVHPNNGLDHYARRMQMMNEGGAPPVLQAGRTTKLGSNHDSSVNPPRQQELFRLNQISPRANHSRHPWRMPDFTSRSTVKTGGESLTGPPETFPPSPPQMTSTMSPLNLPLQTDTSSQQQSLGGLANFHDDVKSRRLPILGRNNGTSTPASSLAQFSPFQSMFGKSLQ